MKRGSSAEAGYCRFAVKQSRRFARKTWSLTLLNMQVVFHLQTRSPPILPPICELFGMSADVVEARPLHEGRPADMSLLKVITTPPTIPCNLVAE